jgi:hypothetical protein
MKKLTLVILLFLSSILSIACHSSYTTLISGPTLLSGGQYQTTVQFCIGQTVNWGGTDNFTVTLNGANFVSYSPTSISNTYNANIAAMCKQTGINQSCQSILCRSITANATSSSTTNVISYSTSSSTPTGWPLVPNDIETCGINSVSYCFSFTFVSDAQWTSIALNGNTETQRGYIGCPCPFATPTQGAPCNGSYDAAMTLNWPIIVPVQLSDFTGENRITYNELTWTTLTEINNDYFTIDKSADGINWHFLDRVQGSGNSNKSVTYVFNDLEGNNRTYYYRLTQTDYNGLNEVFKSISIPGNPPDQEIPIAYDNVGRVIIDPEQYIGMIIYKYKNGFWYKYYKLK